MNKTRTCSPRPCLPVLPEILAPDIDTRGEERRGDVESGDFSREVLIIDDFTYDFRWELLEFTISASHFMMCFEHLAKTVLI